jgi:hypothetical protein
LPTYEAVEQPREQVPVKKPDIKEPLERNLSGTNMDPDDSEDEEMFIVVETRPKQRTSTPIPRKRKPEPEIAESEEVSEVSDIKDEPRELDIKQEPVAVIDFSADDQGEEEGEVEDTGEQTSLEDTGEQTSLEVTGEQTSLEATGEQTSLEVTGEQASLEETGELNDTERSQGEAVARALDDQENGVEPEQSDTLRRSSRTTAGKHSNPYRMPKSALDQGIIVTGNTGPTFEDFSRAIANLGTSLGQVLQTSWEQARKSQTDT